mgnify:CR=1 FL=1
MGGTVVSKYLRIPFDEEKCDSINEELSVAEQKGAIIRAYNQQVSSSDESADELAQYDSVRAIRDDDSISEEERKRRVIRAKRLGIPR